MQKYVCLADYFIQKYNDKRSSLWARNFIYFDKLDLYGWYYY